MITAAIAFALSMICAALLTPAVRRIAHRIGALDHALAARKIHGRPVPRLGGIAIVLGFYAPLVALLFVHGVFGETFVDDPHLVIGLFVGGIAIAALGIYDDLRGCTAQLKFGVQFAVALLIYALGFRAEELGNPFGDPIQLGWVSLPFTLLWVVGIINAMNLVDGLDGLAGGIALVAVTMIFTISLHALQPLMILFCAALAGSIAGFLFYNFNPASIFMGDTGSMFLGFVLAASSIKTGYKSSTAITMVMVVLAFPILDTLLALARRAVRGRPLFHGDKEHIHHKLMGLGLGHRQAVLVLYVVSLVLGLAALAIWYVDNPTLALVLTVTLAAIAVVALRRLGYIRFEIVRELAMQRRRNRELSSAVRPVASLLRRASSSDELWSAVQAGGAVFEASLVRLQLPVRTMGVAETVPSSMFHARFNLPRVRDGSGFVVLGWQDGRSALDRDIEIAIEIFCDEVGEAYERIRYRAS